jgi:hypothetical protein
MVAKKKMAFGGLLSTAKKLGPVNVGGVKPGTSPVRGTTPPLNPGFPGKPGPVNVGGVKPGTSPIRGQALPPNPGRPGPVNANPRFPGKPMGLGAAMAAGMKPPGVRGLKKGGAVKKKTTTKARKK